MKSSDLRLGNLVWNHVQGIAVRVDLRILGQMVAAEKGFGEVWRPIPLTEDWLIKFGFELFNNNYIIDIDSLDKQLILINVNDIIYPIIEVAPEMSHEDVQQVSLNCIKYVYQLQNLYFILTGKELELKK